MLAGSISVGISEDPATGPALSKGNNFFDDDEEASEGNRGNAPYSVWGE
ncbi:toxin PIN [Hoylesella saccharolytica]|nr:toxin PIN [Hoylesella saccharolytica]